MAAFEGVEGSEWRLWFLLQNWILRSPPSFRVECLVSAARRCGGGVASGADGDDGVDSASRGLGLRYKANIFPRVI